MQKEMVLKCLVQKQDQNGRYLCTVQMYDGTEVTLRAMEQDVRCDGKFTEDRPVVDGWVNVIQQAQQGNRVGITLPQPSDLHGYQITVSIFDLMPRHVSIKNFTQKAK